MNRLGLLLGFVAATACGSPSATSDQTSTFAGDWGGQGTMLITGYQSVPGGGTPLFTTATYVALRLTSNEPNVVQVAGVLPSISIPMQVTDGSSLAVTNYASTPTAAQCSDTSCASPTDAVTVRDGHARIENGLLFVMLDGERTTCCAKDSFVAHFLGAHP